MAYYFYDFFGIDYLNYTSSDDLVAYGYGGNNFIWGNYGNDYIDGGTGNDTLKGNSGNDNIYDRTGNDSIERESGNNTKQICVRNGYIHPKQRLSNVSSSESNLLCSTATSMNTRIL